MNRLVAALGACIQGHLPVILQFDQLPPGANSSVLAGLALYSRTPFSLARSSFSDHGERQFLVGFPRGLLTQNCSVSRQSESSAASCTFPSWNQLSIWLQLVDGLRRVA